MSALTESEFLATMRAPMIDVTANVGEVIDIWTYASSIARETHVPALVVDDELVETVYRSGDGAFDHVLLPTEDKDRFVVIVVDRNSRSVVGHHILDLNEKYGVTSENFPND